MAARILVVEDTASNRELLGFLLRHYGYEVLEAENGLEGIEMARSARPDMILMDIQMPVMDGLTAMEELRKHAETSSMKIVAVTSFAMKGDREKTLQAGFDGYISKPIDVRAFPETIRKLLAGEGTDTAEPSA